MTKFLNTDLDSTLGGLTPSDEKVSSQKAVDLPSLIPFPNFREFGSYGGSTRGGDVSSRTLAMEYKQV